MATEKRLMCVDEVKKNLCHYCNTYMSEEPCEPGECWVHDVIAQTDTVDAVEVVRCKDCKHWDADLYWCDKKWGRMFDNDYCSYGERKSNED